MWLEEQMKDFPGGTWIVLKGRTKKLIDLITIGYKYNKKKVLIFVLTKGAGSTKAGGTPYEARYTNAFGNVHVRYTLRPKIISCYFKYSHLVDTHNMNRQSTLALEEYWVTQDPYFRIFTTFIGMTVTNLWYLMRGENNKKYRKLLTFTDRLSFSILESAAEQEQIKKTEEATEKETIKKRKINTDTIAYQKNQRLHLDYWLPKSNKNNVVPGICELTESKRHGCQAHCMWCSRINNKVSKTRLICVNCDASFCPNSTGRDCWNAHIIHGGVPERRY